jgi:hypothetical protein
MLLYVTEDFQTMLIVWCILQSLQDLHLVHQVCVVIQPPLIL